MLWEITQNQPRRLSDFDIERGQKRREFRKVLP